MSANEYFFLFHDNSKKFFDAMQIMTSIKVTVSCNWTEIIIKSI